jgi:ABC-type multidrug transport system fused ATPase/permease subunit
VVGFIMGAVHSMGSDFPRILEQSRKVDRYLHIVQADKARIHGKELPRDLQAITFDAVTFNYEDKPSVLKDVSFTINPGERVALVGPSGAGKSTIIKLLYGHYEPKQGNIRIGDLDISEVKLQSLRTYLSLVPQDVELFDNTIKNNIGIGLGEINEKDLVQASSQAAFHDFVQTLDEGYETMIGERGLKLSGGQRQRLAIARALIRKPKLLVLDEATSSLDSESEFYIQEALKNIDHSQTMLIIAHRLSTIKHCDKIIVLDQGKVVEQGSHDELLANEGLYAKLVALQDKGRL